MPTVCTLFSLEAMKNSILAVSALLMTCVISTLLSIQCHRHCVIFDHRNLVGDEPWENSVKKTRWNTSEATTMAAETVTTTDNSCFPYNSKQWLTEERFGNADVVTGDSFVRQSILNLNELSVLPHKESVKILLKQTICNRESSFLSWDFSGPTSNDNNPQRIQQLALRLLYLAIHIHQHYPAFDEAQHRLNQSPQCHRQMEHYGVGNFDYECRTAKFLVVPMKDRGLGAVLRSDATTALMAGIATNRVVLFINNSPMGPSYIQSPWSWSSCQRLDKQCFFLPDSPCVLSHADFQNATILTKGERRQLFKTGRVPEHTTDNRVIMMNMYTRPQRTPPGFRQRVAEIIHQRLIQPMINNNPNDSRLASISQSVNFILRDDEHLQDVSVFSYFGRNSTAHHAMILYAMRPHLQYTKELNQRMHDIFDNHRRDDKNRLMLGLPIRASDKCDIESECPSFDLYMDLMQTFWEKHGNDLVGIEDAMKSASVILTSESVEMYKAQQNYQRHYNLSFPLGQASNKFHAVPFDFITSATDVVQDTGDPTKLNGSKNVSMEDTLLSTVASLQMQFHSDYSAGNCCSNHHLLLVDLMHEGCGIRQHPDVSQCMQDHEDPKFRLCCAWTKTPECLDKREKRKKAKPALSN